MKKKILITVLGICVVLALGLGIIPVKGAAPLFGWNPTPVEEGNEVTFSTIASYAEYKWWISDGPGTTCTTTEASSEAIFSYDFIETGDYQVCLWVKDEAGVESTDSQTVTVNNLPPAIDEPITWTAKSEPSVVGAPFHVEVGFTDYEDMGYECSINYGDGTGDEDGTISPLGENVWLCTGPDHSYTTTGSFNVSATVTDTVDEYGSSTSDYYNHEVTCAQAITVTSNADDGSAGTLRQAIANICPGGTIDFDEEAVLDSTIKLGGTELLINKSLTINVPQTGLLTISGGVNSGGASSRVFHLLKDPSYTSISVTMSGLTIINGGTPPYGGGILMSKFTQLTMNDCVIGPGNIVTVAGGGIANDGGTLMLNRSTVTGNHGTGTLGGAGIITYNQGSTTLINSTVSGNVTNNNGGGIYVANASTLHLIHSTITKNTANEDYLDYPFGGVGGIQNDGGTVNIQNSIVAGNIDKTALTNPLHHTPYPDVFGSFNSSGGNLIGTNTGSSGWSASDRVGTAANPINPMLDELKVNSPGFTPTHALSQGSTAIEAATCLTTVKIDQRGVDRPTPVESTKCDAGAFESELIPLADTTMPFLTVPDNMTVPATSASGAMVTFTATAFDNVDGILAPICTPASGSTFPVGTTTVNCTATDTAGNTSSNSFTVTVKKYMYLQAISVTPKAGRTTYTLTGLVTIRAFDDSLLSKVAVEGAWSTVVGTPLDPPRTSPVSVTNRNGTAKFTLRGVAAGTYKLCVTSVVKAGWVNMPDPFIETCQEITVPQP